MGAAEVAIRPEAVRLVPASPSTQGLAGVVRRRIYLGSHMEYEAETSMGKVFVTDHGGDRPLTVGASVLISVLPGGATLIGDPAQC